MTKVFIKIGWLVNTWRDIFTGCLALDMDLAPAVLQDEAFLKDVKDKSKTKNRISLWWLGQSGFLLQWNDIHILIDPYLSDSLTKKYEGSDKPHIRICQKVIDPARLDFIDIVTSSHNHTDHLDAETLIPILQVNPGIQMIIPEANRAFVCERIHTSLSFPHGLNDDESISIHGIKFHGIPAAHNELERDATGHCRFMGYIIECGSKKIYHSGDTVWYPGMVDILKPFHIDLALLPINGNDPARGIAGNLNTTEAAELAISMGARITVPCHYNMFSFNTADVNLFTRACEERKIAYKVMNIGESISLS